MKNSKPIQAVPAGLLGFFQLKNNGQNPAEFPDVLQPNIDLLEWYLQSYQELASQQNLLTYAPGSSSQLFPLVVPSDQWWWLSEVSLQIPLLLSGSGTPDYVKAALFVQFGGNAFRQLCDIQEFSATATEDAFAWMRLQKDRMLIPPGSQFGILYERASFGAPPNSVLSITYTPARA